MSDQILINTGRPLRGEMKVPGDKSISHRALILGSLAKGETLITNFLSSADCLATAAIFRQLGIRIIKQDGRVAISGKGLKGLNAPTSLLDVGNSGTSIRLLSGVLAGQSFITEISGDDSIRRRPMGRVARPLQQMGAVISGRLSGEEIYAPLKINGGKLQPIDYQLPVPSAQVKSAVLLAGLFAAGETSVTEKILSRDHTERMLEYFGAQIKRSGLQTAVVGGSDFSGQELDIPGDLSSAAFFLVASAIVPGSELKITDVGLNPTRTGIIEVLHRMGANLQVENERIVSGEPRGEIIIKSSELKGIELSGEIIPRIIDEIPVIAVAATQAVGKTEIRGAKELRVKESDRIKTTAAELRKMGAEIEELPDGLIINGPTKLHGGKIESWGDHRIAMAASVAGLAAEGETVINNTACVETSFPGFKELLYKVAL
jgi:3-phosphoshikimate 1-carboxyvinyltransferase